MVWYQANLATCFADFEYKLQFMMTDVLVDTHHMVAYRVEAEMRQNQHFKCP